jgi:multiple sugar transport system ATP-binding protein
VSAIALDQVTKVFDGGVRAVDSVSLDVTDGELLVLLGPSGCGKTTLLRLIAGLDEITSGELRLDGQPVTSVEPGDRNVAMVFQHSALYPHLTVRENLAFPLLTAGGADRQAVDARVSEIAYGMGLDEQLDRKPATLSGGEKQRVAMGRALILRGPTVLLMDEPLASLDVGTRNGLRAEIRSLIRAMRLTTIYVTHDQAEALSLADRIVVLRDGAVEDVGTPVRIYEEPATAFAAAFLGSPQINLAWATIGVQDEDRIVIDFAEQRLELPWSDPRRPALAPYDGQPVIAGIRPEALAPQPADAAAPGPAGRAGTARGAKARGRPGKSPAAAGYASALRGRVAALEYYGHEWLARLDVGLRPVDLDALPATPGPLELEPGSKRGRGHRGSSLLIRFDTPRDWAAGQEVEVAVDMDRVLLFDAAGRRIGPFSTADPAGPAAASSTGDGGTSASAGGGGAAGGGAGQGTPGGTDGHGGPAAGPGRPGRRAARSATSGGRSKAGS